jgi:hypothetical protein
VNHARHLINFVACGVALGWLALLWSTLTPHTDDFKIYWLAAQAMHTAGSPYAFEPFVYPPTMALLVEPLTITDQETAQHLWFICNSLFAVGLVGVCLRAYAVPLARRYWGVVLVLALVLPPTRLSLFLGQVSILVALLVSGCVLLAQRRPWVSGVLLGGAAALKLYPGLLVLYYLGRGPRVIAYSAALAGLIILGGLCIYPGVAVMVEYVQRVLLQSLGHLAYTAEVNISITGFFDRLLTDNPYAVPVAHAPGLSRLLIVLCSLLVVGLAIWRGGIYTWMVAMLLLAPQNGYYNLVILLLPALAIVAELQARPHKLLAAGFALSGLLCMIPPAWSQGLPLYEAVHTRWGVLAVSPAFYGLLLLFGLLLVRHPAVPDSATVPPQSIHSSAPAVRTARG